MEKFVITINRQFGSMGRTIANQMSEILDINYYDRDIVEKTANQLNLSVSIISAAEEYARSRFAFMRYPLGNEVEETQDKIYMAQEGIIRELASNESCIIVGRCADYILKDFDRKLNIYIYASKEERFQNCINSLSMSPDEAKYMIKAVDKARDTYHKKYAGYLPNDTNHNDIMINSSLLGIEGTVKHLVEIIKDKFYIDNKDR